MSFVYSDLLLARFRFFFFFSSRRRHTRCSRDWSSDVCSSDLARGVDLAPFLRRFADSVRLRGRGAKPPGATMSAPIAVGAVEEQPALVSHPPIRYPPEMQSLRVDGTVLVEAALDVTGHVEPGSARIVQSPNHALDEEALRVEIGRAHRPARSEGRAVRAVIRQAISFVNY